MTPTEILDIPLSEKAAGESGATTIRGYLVALVREVWREGECFSGKRPFGNSGWPWDIYASLIAAGAMAGKFDEYGYPEPDDPTEGDRLILSAIDAMGDPR